MPPVRHHTVSAFLLEKFARQTRAGRTVCMLEKSSGRPRQVSPRDATVRRHFYSIDLEDGQRNSDAIEGILGTIESAAAPLIARIEAGDDLPVRNDRLSLALFLAVCWLRTPAWRANMADVLEQMTAAMMAESYRKDPDAAQRAFADSDEPMTRDEIEAFRKQLVADLDAGRVVVEMPRNAMIKHFLEAATGASWTMFMLDWTVVRVPDDEAELVIADNPVSLYDPAPAFPGGGVGLMSSPRAQAFIPIAPHVALLLESNEEMWNWARENLEAFRQMSDEGRTEVADEREGSWAEGVPTSDFLLELNLRSYATAERFIFGSQQAVTQLHAIRRTQAQRLAQVAPRGPRMHLVEDDPGSPSGLRITRAFGPRP